MKLSGSVLVLCIHLKVDENGSSQYTLLKYLFASHLFCDIRLSFVLCKQINGALTTV